jgi:N-acetylglutamate synthase-like GNAT family acetyltransferase
MAHLIRNANEQDIPDLCRLMSQLTGHAISTEAMRDRLAMVNTSPIDELLVIESDGAVRGLLGFRIRENLEEPTRFGEISAIVVDPEVRGTGLGRALMEYAENLARERKCIGTWLVSGFGREEEAHHFYKRLGYQNNGYRFVKK